MVGTDEASDWPSGTSGRVANWGPFTHQHYLKTTHISKDLLLCQTPLHILPAFHWNGNTLPSPPPLKKKNDRQAACTFCSCVRQKRTIHEGKRCIPVKSENWLPWTHVDSLSFSSCVAWRKENIIENEPFEVVSLLYTNIRFSPRPLIW